MLAGAAIFVVASLLYVVATSVPLLLGVRILHGIGMALFTTAAYAIVADLAPVSRRGEALGLWGTVPTVGSALAPFLGLMLRDRYGYNTVFIISACLALLALLLLAFLREPANTWMSVSPSMPGIRPVDVYCQKAQRSRS